MFQPFVVAGFLDVNPAAYLDPRLAGHDFRRLAGLEGPMLRNSPVTAQRNLMRNRLYAGITILGLAVAFTAAILIGQFVRGELTYDHWIPGYQRVYKIAFTLVQPAQPAMSSDQSPVPLTSQLKAAFPGAEAIARLEQAFPPAKARPGERGRHRPHLRVVRSRHLPGAAPAGPCREPGHGAAAAGHRGDHSQRGAPLLPSRPADRRHPDGPDHRSADAGQRPAGPGNARLAHDARHGRAEGPAVQHQPCH